MTLDYILSMTICLSVLLGFYKLLLADNKAHHFKRLYLLIGLCFSIVAPLLTIYHADVVTNDLALDLSLVADGIETMIKEKNTSMISVLLPTVYYATLIALLGRLAFNYFMIIRRFYKSPKQVFENYTLVFLNDNKDDGPYSFGQYIFVPQSFYLSDLWDERLLEHELGHVRQRHSLDIMLVEILKCVFWFQPFIYLFKKEIKFNHELLADDAVIQKYRDPISYQKLLYSMVSKRNRYPLISSLSYSLTKKRFQMIKKKPDRARSIITSLLSVPVFVGLLLCVGQTACSQDGDGQHSAKENSSQLEEYKKNALVAFETENGIVYKKYSSLTEAEKVNIPAPPPPPPPPPPGMEAEVNQKSYVVITKEGKVKAHSDHHNKAHSEHDHKTYSKKNAPPPPPPPVPEDYIQSIEKQNGSFTYNGKVISRGKALQLLTSSIESSQSKELPESPFSVKTVREDDRVKLVFTDK